MTPPTEVATKEKVNKVKIIRRRNIFLAFFATKSKSVCIIPVSGNPPGDLLATTFKALLYRSTDFPEKSWRS